MTHSVDDFSSQVSSHIFIVQHGSSHLLNNPILSFYYTILLRSNRSREFLRYNWSSAKGLYIRVLEFFTVITPNSIDLWALSFCNLVHKASMCSGASDLDLKRKTQLYRVKLSTTTTMYLFPSRDLVLVGPMKSRCSSSNSLDAKDVWVPGCLAFVYFPSWHGPHTTLFTLLSLGIPKTDSCVETIEKCL